MMPEGNGLGALQMGISRHYGVGVPLRFFKDNRYKLGKLSVKRLTLFSEIKPYIHRYLVVAAAGGMKPFACRSDTGSQLALNKSMYILRVRVNQKGSVFNLLTDCL